MTLFFLAAPDTARGQAVFPIGLHLEYHVEQETYYGSSEMDREFEVIQWAPEVGPNILEAEIRLDGYETTVYFDAGTWETYTEEGDDTGTYLAPPYWMTTSTMVVGAEIEIDVMSSYDIEYIVQGDTMVTVPAGTFMCKHLRYEDDIYGLEIDSNIYYEINLGIMVKIHEIMPDYDMTFDCELTESNMSNYLILGMSPLFLFGSIAGIVILVVVIVVIVLVVRKLRSRGGPSPTIGPSPTRVKIPASFCGNCGAHLKGKRVCSRCGTAVED
ncbi:MAG: hypothetical protein ACFFCO_05940 [Promethearchaeota archaeon]